MGKLTRVISADASVVAMAIDATDIVAEIERIHQTSAVVTAALGRLSIAASLMGYGLKGENDSLTVRFNGNGATGSLVAVSDSRGNVKSYVQNAIVEIPLNQYGKLDVKGAVGTNGTLSVAKDIGMREPYIGQVPIVSGEIAEDITHYLATSEQTPTVCGLGVLVNPNLTVNVAGGYLIQLLPFADEECISIIEKNINNLPSVTNMMSEGVTSEQMAFKLLEGLNPNILDEAEAFYRCDCSRERTKGILNALSNDDLNDLGQDEETQAECNFCDKVYKFTKAEILEMRK